jgi:glycosyltransferase involved in cell wall biosynthesis
LSHGRVNDYRAEFAFNHPDAPPAAAEYAVEGLAGSIYYFWPMLRTVVAAARAIAVHNPYVAAELQTQFPTASITTIRMGVPRLRATPEARAHVRTRLNIPESTVAFAALGKVTAAKRIGATLRAVGQLAREGIDACLLLVGDTEGAPELKREAAAAGVADRLRTVGFVDDAEIAEYLEAADACLCLRWPTAQETSASWLRCLAAHRATVVSNLAHLADVPDGVALRVDLLDEDASLVAAMRRLAVDPRLRTAIADAGHHYWADNHTLEAMADDYQRLLRAAAARPVSTPTALPPHLTRDYSELTRATLEHFGVSIALPG